MEKLYLVVTIQYFTDGDGIEQSDSVSEICDIEEVNERLSHAIGEPSYEGDVIHAEVEGQTGEYNYGEYLSCAMHISPVRKGVVITSWG